MGAGKCTRAPASARGQRHCRERERERREAKRVGGRAGGWTDGGFRERWGAAQEKDAEACVCVCVCVCGGRRGLGRRGRVPIEPRTGCDAGHRIDTFATRVFWVAATNALSSRSSYPPSAFTAAAMVALAMACRPEKELFVHVTGLATESVMSPGWKCSNEPCQSSIPGHPQKSFLPKLTVSAAFGAAAVDVLPTFLPTVEPPSTTWKREWSGRRAPETSHRERGKVKNEEWSINLL